MVNTRIQQYQIILLRIEHRDDWKVLSKNNFPKYLRV